MRCVVLDDYQNVAARFADWTAVDVELESVTEHIADEAELAERIAGAEIVVAMRERTRFTPSLFARLDGLQLLVTTGMRNAAIDMSAATEHAVVVCGTGGIVTPTSELTWGLIHALTRHVVADDATMRAGGWQTRIGLGLAGLRLGLLGLGNIGAQVARVGLAFDMDVVAWSQHLTPARAAEVGVGLVTKAELLATSDVVSIHLVLSERTRGLIGAPELATMRPSALLVNTSRGPIVDQDALVAALQGGAIAGAGLDVFDVEPLPVDDPLRTLANTVLTPHTGYVVAQCYELFYRHIVEDIAAWLGGQPIRVII
ncbi:MAG: D-2-hydroxyacid dehydrogenase family protein [Ilumatobacteraceae bacterium]